MAQFANKVAKTEDQEALALPQPDANRTLSAAERNALLSRLRSGMLPMQQDAAEREAEAIEQGLEPDFAANEMPSRLPSVQRKPEGSPAYQELPEWLEKALLKRETMGMGYAMDGELLRFANEWFGHTSNFEGVKVHIDEQVDALCMLLGALAFTHNGNIYVSRKVNLSSDKGRGILLHELAHVRQQGAQDTGIHVRRTTRLKQNVPFKHRWTAILHDHPFDIQLQMGLGKGEEIGMWLHVTPLTKYGDRLYGTSKSYGLYELFFPKDSIDGRIMVQMIRMLNGYPEGLTAEVVHSAASTYHSLVIYFESLPMMIIEDKLEPPGTGENEHPHHLFSPAYSAINSKTFYFQERSGQVPRFAVWPLGSVGASAVGTIIYETEPGALARTNPPEVFSENLLRLEQSKEFIQGSFHRHDRTGSHYGFAVHYLKEWLHASSAPSLPQGRHAGPIVSQQDLKRLALFSRFVLNEALDNLMKITQLEFLVYGAQQEPPDGVKEFFNQCQKAYVMAIYHSVLSPSQEDQDLSLKFLAEAHAYRVAAESMAITEAVSIHGKLKHLVLVKGRQLRSTIQALQDHDRTFMGGDDMETWRMLSLLDIDESILLFDIERLGKEVAAGFGPGADVERVSKDFLTSFGSLNLQAAYYISHLTALLHFELINRLNRAFIHNWGRDLLSGWMDESTKTSTQRFRNNLAFALEKCHIQGLKSSDSPTEQLEKLGELLAELHVIGTPEYQKNLEKAQVLLANVNGVAMLGQILLEVAITVASMLVTMGASAAIIGGLRLITSSRWIITAVQVGVEALAFTASSRFFHLALGQENHNSFAKDFLTNLLLFGASAMVGAMFARLGKGVFETYAKAQQELAIATESGSKAAIRNAELNLAAAEGPAKALQGLSTATNIVVGHLLMEGLAQIEGHPMGAGDRAQAAFTVTIMHLVGALTHKYINAEVFTVHYLEELHGANLGEANLARAIEARGNLDKLLRSADKPDVKLWKSVMKELQALMRLEPSMDAYIKKLSPKDQNRQVQALEKFRASMKEIQFQMGFLGAFKAENGTPIYRDVHGIIRYKQGEAEAMGRFVKDLEANGAKVDTYPDGSYSIDYQGIYFVVRPEQRSGERPIALREADPLVALTVEILAHEKENGKLPTFGDAAEMEAFFKKQDPERFEHFPKEEFEVALAMLSHTNAEPPVLRNGSYWHSLPSISRYILSLPEKLLPAGAKQWLSQTWASLRQQFARLPSWARRAILASATVGLGVATLSLGGIEGMLSGKPVVEASMAGVGMMVRVAMTPGSKPEIHYIGTNPAKDFFSLAQAYKMLTGGTFADFKAWAQQQPGLQGFDIIGRAKAFEIAEASAKHGSEIVLLTNEWMLTFQDGLAETARSGEEMAFLLDKAETSVLSFFAEATANMKHEAAVPDAGKPTELSWNRYLVELVRATLLKADSPAKLSQAWTEVKEMQKVEQRRQQYDSLLKTDVKAARAQLGEWILSLENASRVRSQPVPEGYMQLPVMERNLLALEWAGKRERVQRLLSGESGLPEAFAVAIRAIIENPAYSKGKRMLKGVSDALNKDINLALGRELAHITDPALQSAALKKVIEMLDIGDMSKVSENLIMYDQRLQAQMYSDMLQPGQLAKVIFLPQVELPLAHIEGPGGKRLSHGDTRSPDFLVYIVPGPGGPLVRVVILDVKTGYTKTPVDPLQAQDYFLAVEQFMERNSEGSAAIREVLSKRLAEAENGVHLAPDMLRLVQVDWLFMPGREQTGSMSAREVAERKVESIQKVGKSLEAEFNIYYYETGNIRKLEERN